MLATARLSPRCTPWGTLGDLSQVTPLPEYWPQLIAGFITQFPSSTPICFLDLVDALENDDYVGKVVCPNDSTRNIAPIGDNSGRYLVYVHHSDYGDTANIESVVRVNHADYVAVRNSIRDIPGYSLPRHIQP